MNDLSYECLHKMFLYDEKKGTLIWRNRDPSDAKSTRGMNIFNARYAGKVAGSISTCGKSKKKYIAVRISGALHYAHRIIYTIMTGQTLGGMQIDHIDGDGLNNAWDNLRAVSNSDNAKNLKRRRDNSTGHVGVYYLPEAQKWMASIGVDGKIIHLGRFSTKQEAIAARLNAQKKHGFHKNHGKESICRRLELALRESKPCN